MGTKNTRQLAAVMFTDIVGYTAMMQEDETKANSQRDRHRSVLKKRALEFDGKTLHHYGDGALTIFSSAFNAVRCAIKIQEDLTQPTLPLRIGIHIGDIAFNQDDVYGDAVNIAARLESISVSGGILISDKVVEEVKNHPEIKTTKLGTFELKNVQRPLQIYAVSNEGLQIPSAKDIQAKENGTTKRIAVLPFVNMSEELGFDFFCDGLTEEIINGLTKMRQLEVTSRTSAFAFKNHNEDVRSIGEKLSVNHVLEGSVRKNKDKVRVTAQLIEADEGFHLWSETYEYHLKDIFEIQDHVSDEILEKFQSAFGGSKIKSEKERLSNDQEALKAYLEGTFQWNKWTISSVQSALRNFSKAIEADPEFDKAYIALANCYIYLATKGQMSARLGFGKAEKLVSKALELDAYFAEAHAASGLIKALYYQQFEEANDAFTQSFEIGENMANPYYYYFLFLNAIGENDAALLWMEKALSIYPTNLVFNSELARAYYFNRRYDEALEQYNYTLEMDSSFLPALDGKGWTYIAMGEEKKAHQIFETYQNLVFQEQKNIPQLVYLAARLGMEEVAEHFLEVLQLGGESDKYITTPIDIALIYLGMQRYDEVFFHLNRAVEDKMAEVLFITSDPVWDEIRQDSRFQDLLEQLNISKQKGMTQYARVPD